MKWGDEVEYNLVRFDKGNEETSRKAQLLLKAEEMLKVLQVPENEGQQNLPSLWRPEYAAYMVEGTPGNNYLVRYSFLVGRICCVFLVKYMQSLCRWAIYEQYF